MTTNEEILGRATSTTSRRSWPITNTDVDEVIHTVKDNADAIFTWDYEKGAAPGAQQALREGQDVAVERRDRPRLVDSTSTSRRSLANDAMRARQADPVLEAGIDLRGHAVRQLGRQGVAPAASIESQNWTLSQFMHGEQGALICTAKIVETVPWIDAKYYAATQVMDEARHVEVFAKYLDTKLNGHYPINAHLKMLLDDIINDSRWDMTYLGMQIMVEGLALAAFGFMHLTHRRSRCSSSCSAT